MTDNTTTNWQRSLQALSSHCSRIAQACPPAGASLLLPASSGAAAATHHLDWLRALTGPVTSFRTSNGDERILDLLRLRHALQHDAANFDNLAAPVRRQVAFQLARELPHFDRDLTAYYMQPPPDTPEYELHVAHSLLRLDPSAHPTYQSLLAALPTWRHSGLVHVLAVAAVHMPAVADWFPRNPPSQNREDAACALHECLAALNATPQSYGKHMQDLVTLLDCEDTATTQAFFRTLDTAAVLMRVKSNAPASAPGGHCLDSALATFPTEEECALDASKLPQLWASVKPALERALPPSLLLPRPADAAAVWSDTPTPTHISRERVSGSPPIHIRRRSSLVRYSHSHPHTYLEREFQAHLRFAADVAVA